MTGLVGPDGAGKTTLIRLLAGLMLPTAGEIIVCGDDTQSETSHLRHMVSYMPQRFGLYEDLSVAENLRLYADLRGVVGAERDAAFGGCSSFTAWLPLPARLAGKLSGGMKQKLGLACALIHTPRLLLLDEPSVGVDPISRRELWRMVYDLVDEGIGVVWSTAYLDEAERCSTVLLLNEGQQLYFGPPKELTARTAGRSFLLENLGAREAACLGPCHQTPGSGRRRDPRSQRATGDRRRLACPQPHRIGALPTPWWPEPRRDSKTRLSICWEAGPSMNRRWDKPPDEAAAPKGRRWSRRSA